MSIQKNKRNKDTIFNLRLFKEDVDFVGKFAGKHNLNKVDVIEALIHHLRYLSEEDQKQIVIDYLIRSLKKPC